MYKRQALMYRLMWALADMREALMRYEDTGLTPDQIEALLEERKWIPVAEQLPEIGEPVLVTLWDRDVTIGTWYGHRWGTALYYSEDVLAWMPKPENYRPAD